MTPLTGTFNSVLSDSAVVEPLPVRMTPCGENGSGCLSSVRSTGLPRKVANSDSDEMSLREIVTAPFSSVSGAGNPANRIEASLARMRVVNS